MFGSLLIDEQVFAFYALTSIFFVSFTMAILFHIGFIQAFIYKWGSMAKYITMTTYVESSAALARLFLGVSESFMVVGPFLEVIFRLKKF